jgi:hypothetical protein
MRHLKASSSSSSSIFLFINYLKKLNSNKKTLFTNLFTASINKSLRNLLFLDIWKFMKFKLVNIHKYNFKNMKTKNKKAKDSFSLKKDW